MYPKVEDVTEIIEQMDSFSPSEKMHFSAVFKSLMDRQEALFDGIKEDIKREISFHNGEILDIYVALAGPEMKKEIREYGFFEVCPDISTLVEETIEIKNKTASCIDEYSCGVIFWNADYDLISTAVSNKYEAIVTVNNEKYEATYSLRETGVFVEKEKDIQKISMQYGIETPLLYNPMARRALEVVVKLPCDIKKNDEAVINLEFEKNGLKHQILINSYLVWNISEKQYDELPSAKTGNFEDVVPLWDKTFLIYRFSVKNKNENVRDYILVNNDLRAIKRVGDDIYWQLKEEGSEMTYKKFSIYAVSDVVKNMMISKSIYLFHNDYDVPSTGEIERIRTKGDAMRCVSCFKRLKISCSDILSEKEAKNKEVVYTYKKRLDYYQLKDERLKTASRYKICFEKKEDSFFIDKVSYIIGYMNHRYPEYQWTGVC